MFEIGIPAMRVHLRLSTLIAILFAVDVIVIRKFYYKSSRESTFYTWILFDSMTMITMLFISCIKYAIHVVDLVSINRG